MPLAITEKKAEVDAWVALLDDSTALLACPGVHHKLLLQRACALHTSQIVSPEEYSDMLELADGALAYAIEAQLDRPTSNSVSQCTSS
ncbi:hypothetical protein ABNM62_19230 [Pseudomonas syringae]|uniref:hypothetical protein n=1 Tax=Pseudomonas syringae TaxID=317 RepID=UPI0032D91967